MVHAPDRLSTGRPAGAWLALAAIVSIAAALRIPWLEGIPSPAGDEGNWTWFGYDLSIGRPAPLAPDARFVSLAFAHLIALSFRIAGAPSFAAARAVCVAGVLLAMLLCYAACAAMGTRRAGLVVAATLAVHPWAVVWSRTVAVPYALSLSLSVAGPLAMLAGARSPSSRARTAWWLLASQCLFGALHFSPVALIPLLACGVWLVARRRSFLLEKSTWIALVTGLPHLLVIARGAMDVAAGTTGRPHHQFTALGARIGTYARALLDGVSGEATVRHFAGVEYHGLAEALVATALLAALCIAIASNARRTRSADGAEHEILELGLFHLACAVPGLALLLAPARTWNLPAVDAERYAFAFIAPFALVLAGLSASTRTARLVPALVLTWWLGSPTARITHALLRGGGPDRGEYVLRNGGAFRGWKSTSDHIGVARAVQRVLARATGGRPAMLLIADYALHPLHFANVETPWQTRDVSMFGLPALQHGQRCYFALWSDGLFARDYWPPGPVDANARLAATMHADFDRAERLAVSTQPDGAPLLEVWTALAR